MCDVFLNVGMTEKCLPIYTTLDFELGSGRLPMLWKLSSVPRISVFPYFTVIPQYSSREDHWKIRQVQFKEPHCSRETKGKQAGATGCELVREKLHKCQNPEKSSNLFSCFTKVEAKTMSAAAEVQRGKYPSSEWHQQVLCVLFFSLYWSQLTLRGRHPQYESFCSFTVTILLLGWGS